MDAIGSSWETATIQGMLRQGGWGAAMGYPVIDLDEHGGEIMLINHINLAFFVWYFCLS